MRIAVWHNLPSGGGKRALYYHVKGLVERGHHVEIWCPPTADLTFWPLGALAKEHVVEPSPSPARGGPLARRFLWPYRNVTTALRALDRHCVRCAKEIEAGGFDVVFANTCMVSAASPIGRRCARPSVLYLGEPHRRLYETVPELPGWTAPSRHGSVLKRWKSALRDEMQWRAFNVQAREERFNAGGFGVILVNSLFSRESIVRAYGLDAKVCYLGVDVDLFKPAENRANYVVGLGSIAANKGIDRVLAGLAVVPAPVRPPLVWAGNCVDPEYRLYVEDLARSLGVSLSLKVGLSDAEVVRLLGEAVLMLYAPRLEPFGLAPLEANACGTPVVAVAEGGVRETIRDGVNGVLLPDGDPATLARSVVFLLERPALLARLRDSARRDVVENWGWGAAVDRVEGHLRALAGLGARSAGVSRQRMGA
jgi:glycosyltransferase involved in cell wall biosynthesis